MRRQSTTLGIFLILLGVFFLLLNTDLLGEIWGSAVPFFVGIAFLVAYLSGQKWALIPGSIVSCVGVAIVMAASGQFDMEKWWPVFVLGPGIGFWLVRIVGGSSYQWAIFPAFITTLVGLVMFTFSMQIFDWQWWQYINWVWPVVLIILGARLLFKQKFSKETKDPPTS